MSGLTTAAALAQVMILIRIQDDNERRAEIRKVLEQVHSHGYDKGFDDCYETYA